MRNSTLESEITFIIRLTVDFHHEKASTAFIRTSPLIPLTPMQQSLQEGLPTHRKKRFATHQALLIGPHHHSFGMKMRHTLYLVLLMTLIAVVRLYLWHPRSAVRRSNDKSLPLPNYSHLGRCHMRMLRWVGWGNQ